jgi:alpha,alpha-trehalase
MYGWDSFFIASGLLQDPTRVELAQSIADNQAYEIEQYGKILNANRTYYLTRSQPPFLSSLISAVWRSLPDTVDNRAWLERSVRAAIREYRTVWTAKPRRLVVCESGVCLARYFGEGHGEPPEVEPGHFDWFYQAHAVSHGHCRPPAPDDESRARFLECTERLADGYRNASVRDLEIDDFFANDRCVRESGHDTTFRWFRDGRERCTDFATVDLNSLLFKYEVDIATLLANAFGGSLGDESAGAFCARAAVRARLISKYLWDADAGLFYDYDTARRRRSRYLAATALYPLWASQPNVCGATLVTPEMVKALVGNVLGALEAPGGLLAASAASAASVRRPTLVRRTSDGVFTVTEAGRQWEAPNGWAPHQMLAWEALDNAGFKNDARRLRYQWLYTIVKNAASYHGTVPEKFDVVARSHAVFQEYGNVNTEFSYIADEGFGWMNASFVVGWRALDPELRDSLKRLVPPEQLFGGR